MLKSEDNEEPRDTDDDDDDGIDEDQEFMDAFEHGFTHGVHMFNGAKMSLCEKKAIGIAYLLWTIALFLVAFAGVTLTFLDCDHFAEFFFLTIWTLLIVFAYSFFKVISVISFRIELKETIAFGAKAKKTKITWKFNLFLKWIIVKLHPVAFSLTLWVMGLYSIGTAGGISLASYSLIAHFITPSMMIVDFWFSGIPWEINNVYRVGLYGNVYVLFTAFHFFFKLGHLNHTNGGCAGAYANTLLHPDECYIYEKFRMDRWISFLFVLFMVNYIMPFLAFVIHVLQVFWIGGKKSRRYLRFVLNKK